MEPGLPLWVHWELLGPALVGTAEPAPCQSRSVEHKLREGPWQGLGDPGAAGLGWPGLEAAAQSGQAPQELKSGTPPGSASSAS